MVVAYWIVAGLTAVVFLAAGLNKLLRPKAALATSGGLEWVEDFSEPSVKVIAAAEVLGAIGLILPMLTGILPVLSPIAGAGLTVLMIGAAVTHVRRKEPPLPIVLALLAAAAATLGFLILSA